MGVVYHTNYIVWMEVGRVEYFRSLGMRYRDLERTEGILLAVAEANCRYKAPARYDDEVIVKTSVGEATSRMVRFEYELVGAEDGRLLAAGYTKHVFVGRDFRPKRLPGHLHKAFGIAKSMQGGL